MLELKIITPEKVVYNGETDRVRVPGTLGEFEILTGHAPIVSSLQAGRVEYVAGGELRKLMIAGGFVEVLNNNISLCVEC